jgi:hypothetical protein
MFEHPAWLCILNESPITYRMAEAGRPPSTQKVLLLLVLHSAPAHLAAVLLMCLAKDLRVTIAAAAAAGCLVLCRLLRCC